MTIFAIVHTHYGQERYLDLRKIRRVSRKKPGTLGAPVLQRRKPMLLHITVNGSGSCASRNLMFRLAQRRLFAVLFQFPPRFTRLLPLYDTFPSLQPPVLCLGDISPKSPYSAIRLRSLRGARMVLPKR